MEGDDGLAGAGAAGDAGGAGEVLVDERALRGVEEDRPLLPRGRRGRGRARRSRRARRKRRWASGWAKGSGVGAGGAGWMPAERLIRASIASAGRWSARSRRVSSVAARTSASQSAGTPQRRSVGSGVRAKRGGFGGRHGDAGRRFPRPARGLRRAGRRRWWGGSRGGGARPRRRRRRGGRPRRGGCRGPRLCRTMRRSRVTRAVQKSRSRERSTRWSWRPGAEGSTWRSKAACFAAAFSWAVRRVEGGGEGVGDAEGHRAENIPDLRASLPEVIVFSISC